MRLHSFLHGEVLEADQQQGRSALVPVSAAGAGVVDVGAAAAGEVRALPAALAVGRSTGAGWRVRRTFVLENVSTRPVELRLQVAHESEGAAAVDVTLRPTRLVLPRGGRARVASAPPR